MKTASNTNTSLLAGKISLLFVLLAVLVPSACADRCALPITGVDVFGPGQKAIVAWNGETERLILSTDIYSSASTKVLEILPLPSRPRVEEGDFESFHAVQQLMVKKMPRAAVPESKELEIIFHEKVGAHDITVVKAADLKELANFVYDYIRKAGLGDSMPITEKTQRVLQDYLMRDFNYWAFDLVDISSTTRSIEPIIYEFQSPALYYPIKVSSTAKGRAKIILYLITQGAIGEADIPSKMQIGRYRPNNYTVQFQVSHDELAMIDKGIASLFGPRSQAGTPLPAAWLTAVDYEGQLNDLDFDLEIPPSTPRHLIRVESDKVHYDLGEEVKVTVDFIHRRPKFLAIEILHSHQIQLEIFDSNGNPVRSWRWKTDRDLHEEVTLRPNRAGGFTIVASSWWNGLKLEVENEITFSVSDVYTSQNVAVGVTTATVCILLGAGLTYMLLRKRWSRTIPLLFHEVKRRLYNLFCSRRI